MYTNIERIAILNDVVKHKFPLEFFVSSSRNLGFGNRATECAKHVEFGLIRIKKGRDDTA